MTVRRRVPRAMGILCAVFGLLRPAAAGDLPRPVALQGSLAPDGASASIQLSVRNGANQASAPGVLEVYLSGDGLIDDADSRLDRRSIGPLAPGARADHHIRAALPPQRPGRYYIVARMLAADPAAPPPKATDALWGAPLAIGPDLVIDDLRAAAVPEGVRVSGRARNRGTHAAAPASVGVEWIVPDGGPVHRARESVTLDGVAAGAAAAFDVVVTPGDLIAGQYDVIVEIDPDQRALESDEENNRARVEVGFRVGPDLVVADLSARQEGDAVVVRDAVANQGTGSADACGISFFLSRNGVWEQGDVSLGYRMIPALAAGADSRADTRLPIPRQGLVTARYFLIAKVDSANTVAEGHETNNLALAPAPLDLRLPP